MTLPATAGLFSAKGNTDEEKRAKVRKDRDEILPNPTLRRMADLRSPLPIRQSRRGRHR